MVTIGAAAEVDTIGNNLLIARVCPSAATVLLWHLSTCISANHSCCGLLWVLTYGVQAQTANLDTVSQMNVETLKRAATPQFGEHVM